MSTTGPVRQGSTTSGTEEALRDAGLDPQSVLGLVRATLAEDLGARGDITSAATVPADSWLEAAFVSRQHGVAAGLPVLACLVRDFAGPRATLELFVSDGDELWPGQRLASVSAPARSVLGLERTALNLLSHLAGVATVTRTWVDAVAGTGVQVRDTRKTMPLLRGLEKYAVRCGGGVNHRFGLDDAVLIKDNHVIAAGGIGAAIDAAHAAHPGGSVQVQVEVDDLEQLEEAIAHGAHQVLLDNFDLPALRRAVAHVRATAPETVLEASGGLSLQVARKVAATGVDFLAVGALTHSAPALDIGLDAAPAPAGS